MGVLFIDGDFVETLPPGRYAFWKNLAQVKFVEEDIGLFARCRLQHLQKSGEREERPIPNPAAHKTAHPPHRANWTPSAAL